MNKMPTERLVAVKRDGLKQKGYPQENIGGCSTEKEDIDAVKRRKLSKVINAKTNASEKHCRRS